MISGAAGADAPRTAAPRALDVEGERGGAGGRGGAEPEPDSPSG